MAEKGKQCNLCIEFFKYYIKNGTQFQATKFGFCYRHEVSMNIHDTCDKWELRRIKHSGRQLEKKLNELLTEIETIRSIIEAQRDEDENM